MAYLFQCFVLALVVYGITCQPRDSNRGTSNCDKTDFMNMKWSVPGPNGQSVNYMPMLPMVPVVEGQKGDRGDRGLPGICTSNQCKCDCPRTTRHHERRALRTPGYHRNTYEYNRGPAPQALRQTPMKGDKGEMGVMGLAGLPGGRGQAGPKGQKGEAGTSSRSAPPTRYYPAQKGDRGEKGLRGFPGAAGLRGPQGPPGLPGRQGEDGLPGRNGDPGPQGPAGRHGRVGKKGARGQDGIPGVPGGSFSRSGKIAFTAALTENVGPVNLATPIKFRDIILNQGGAYNLITGIFTVPTNGTYVLTFNAMSQYNKALELTLLHNARVISSIHSRDTGGYSGAGNSIAVHLVEGDRLWIELSPGFYYVYGDKSRNTAFSGYLLYPD